jgi:micrococcal nuclease
MFASLQPDQARPKRQTGSLLLTVLALSFSWAAPETGRAAQVTGTVSQVLDGDTFHLDDGRQVRCLGIDAPEKGDALADDATKKLNQLIGGKPVRLELGRPERDRDGRLLAYVFLGKTLVNAEVLRQGCAHVRRPVLAKYKQQLLDAQNDARAAGRGLWRKAAEVNLVISKVQARPPRGEVPELIAEYIVIENQGDRALNMTGWTVSDEANRRYLIPNFVLAPKARVTLYTGLGKNTDTNLFWGSRTAVWNDDGDTVFIKDAAGSLMLVHFY